MLNVTVFSAEALLPTEDKVFRLLALEVPSIISVLLFIPSGFCNLKNMSLGQITIFFPPQVIDLRVNYLSPLFSNSFHCKIDTFS